MPVALAIVEDKPLFNASMFPGDLVGAMLREVHDAWWRAHPVEWGRFARVLERIRASGADDVPSALLRNIEAAIARVPKG